LLKAITICGGFPPANARSNSPTTTARPRTRGRGGVADRSQPIRSATTVAGIDGVSASNVRICGSTASTIEPLAARRYDGGSAAANALRTVFLEIPSLLAITLIGTSSAR
jgi:hypothetical protein